MKNRFIRSSILLMCMLLIGGAAFSGFGSGKTVSAAEYHSYDHPIEGATITITKSNTRGNPAYPSEQDLIDNGVYARYLDGSDEYVLFSDDYTGDVKDGQVLLLQGLNNGFYRVTVHIGKDSTTTSIATNGSSGKSPAKNKPTPAAKVLYTGYATTAVNVRKSPSKSGKILGVLNKGASAQVVKNGTWLKIKYKSGYGYVYQSYISKVRPTLYTAVMATKAFVRSSTAPKYKKLGYVQKGSKVSVVQSNRGWLLVKFGKSYGYIKQADSRKIIGTGTLKSTQTVRAGAGTKYKKLGTLKKGTKVYIVKKGTWDQIVYKTGFGYVMRNQVK
ncbi:SH3 domain-containing protein [Bacillus coagulans]|uniref:SH3 domain-containing protein n=1 Tax=Heyndrickxia coagulans TaxID=1398 RepID=UPI0013770404|nr:SH3 domain-containing protein [Heyndrickxia coagulans]NCG69169.1 SH3 domain-containing protein [Heyndrickxia coagulans]